MLRASPDVLPEFSSLLEEEKCRGIYSDCDKYLYIFSKNLIATYLFKNKGEMATYAGDGYLISSLLGGASS